MDPPFTTVHGVPVRATDAAPLARLAAGGLAAALRFAGLAAVVTLAIVVMVLSMVAAQPTFLG